MAAERLVLDLVAGQNKPYNVQGVADMLATKGVKKPHAEKALEALAEQGKLVRKEFGKTKIFIPSQEGLAALTAEEKTEKEAKIKQLHEEVKREEEGVAELRRELAAASTALTLDQVRVRIAELSAAQAANEAKLAGLRGGARLISAADVQKAEKICHSMIDAWARHRRQFRAVWDTVSEGLDGKEEALFEEIGVDSDKAVGADFEGARALVQPPKKLKR